MMPNPIELMDVETRSIKLLTDMLKNNTLTIDDSFQRRYVWVPKNKISLIETILLGYPIPELYLWQNETDPESGDTKYSIVDGQQRLGAVEAFITNQFRLNNSGLEFTENDYARKFFKDLTDEQKSAIWKYKFSIRFIKEEVTREEIVKIFLRLNSTNTSLNPQELRNAEFNGEFIKLAEQISEFSFWDDYGIFNSGDLRRMLDIQFISTLLIFLRMGIEEETTQSSLNKAYDLYNEKYDEADEDLETCRKALEIIDEFAKHSEFTKEILKKKTHLYALFVLSYYLLNSNTQITDSMKQTMGVWFQCYISETPIGDEHKDLLLSEYKYLSMEGVQKKANRQRRFEILKEITL